MLKKSKRPKIKVVDYRSVNLTWLVAFKDKVFHKRLASSIDLVVAIEDVGTGSNLEIRKGDTLCVTGETATTYRVTRPYGYVRTGDVAKSAVTSKPREEWSTEDVAEYVIKRACMTQQCTFLELIDKPKKNVSKREYQGTFVSQARRCRFGDLVGALSYFFTLHKEKLDEQYVWLDIFSANQPKLTAHNVEPAVRKENERQLTEGLHTAIANFERRVMFMDKWDGAAPLTRAWCVWEIFGVAKAKKQLEIALAESEYDRFIVTLKEDYDSIITKTSAVDVEKAQCFNKADLKAIHKAIHAQSSFRALDNIIKTQLRLWVASTGMLQIEKEEQKANVDFREIRLLANQSGLTYQAQGDFVNAELLLQKALRVALEISRNREKDSIVALQLNNLAHLLLNEGRYEEAKPLYVEAITTWKKIHGPEHHLVATGLNNLGQLYFALGQFNEAEAPMREALALSKKTLGEEHPNVATNLNNLAQVLHCQGRLEEAEQLMIEALVITEKTLGADHPTVGIRLSNMAQLLIVKGKLKEAEAAMRGALNIFRKALGEEHPNVATLLNNLGVFLFEQAKYDEAKPMFEESLAIRRKVLGNEHPDVAESINNLAWLLRKKDKHSKVAQHLGKEALRIAEKKLGMNHPRTVGLREDWG